MLLQRLLDGLDGPVDAGAVAARARPAGRACQLRSARDVGQTAPRTRTRSSRARTPARRLPRAVRARDPCAAVRPRPGRGDCGHEPAAVAGTDRRRPGRHRRRAGPRPAPARRRVAVTAVSQALQASMRVQQKVTELAIKGDRALGTLRPVEERPSWATFDDDDEPPRRRRRRRHRAAPSAALAPEPISPGPVDAGAADAEPVRAVPCRRGTEPWPRAERRCPATGELTIPQLRGQAAPPVRRRPARPARPGRPRTAEPRRRSSRC